MKKLPLTERLEYWKYQCASLTFHNAKAVAEYLIENKRHPLQYQLLTSLYVLYSRPFKQRKQVRISEELVPSEYMEEHSYLIGLRDKMFAHVDTDGLADKNIQHLSKIWLGYRDGGFRAGMASLFPIGFHFERTKELCDYLHEICESKAQEILIDALEGIGPPNLTYEVDIREGNRYLIKHREL